MPGSTTGPSVSLRQPKPCGTAWPRQKMVPVSYLSTKCLGSQANPIFSLFCTAVIPLQVHISSPVAVQEVEGGRKTASGFSSAVLQAPDTDPGEERLPPAQPQAIFKPPFPLYLPADHPMFGWDTHSSQTSSLIPATLALSPQARHLSLQDMDEQGQSHLPRSSWFLKHQQLDPKTQAFCCFSRICDPCPQRSRHSLDHLARSCPEWKLKSSVVELVHRFLPREVSPGPKP